MIIRDRVFNPELQNKLLIKYSDEEFAMHPPTAQRLRHVANEFLRHQDVDRVVDYRGNQARFNNDYKKPFQAAQAPHSRAATAAAFAQSRLEAQLVDPNSTGEDGPKHPRFPNLQKPLEQILCYFCGKRTIFSKVAQPNERLH